MFIIKIEAVLTWDSALGEMNRSVFSLDSIAYSVILGIYRILYFIVGYFLSIFFEYFCLFQKSYCDLLLSISATYVLYNKIHKTTLEMRIKVISYTSYNTKKLNENVIKVKRSLIIKVFDYK